MTNHDWFQDVLNFHKQFGCYIGSTPKQPDADNAVLRMRLIQEEFSELKGSLLLADMPSIADGIVDLIYVLVGTAICYGIDVRPIWNAVHEANMKKTGGGMREDGKVLKPEGWQPPDVEGLLTKQQPLTLSPYDDIAE